MQRTVDSLGAIGLVSGDVWIASAQSSGVASDLAIAAALVVAELPPVTGGSFVTNGGPADRHAMVIRCASGQSNDRSREVSWNIPAPYSTLLGRVTISGKMDPEHKVQLEWFANGARIYNNSTLTLDTNTEFNGELAGVQDLRVRLTCTSSAGVATLLDAAVQR